MMKVSLPCGHDRIHLETPDNNPLVQVLGAKTPPALPDPRRAVADSLQEPIGSPALLDLARGRKSACVVVSDITRPVPNRVILPPILQTLDQAGLTKDKITILVATGMHRPNTREELTAMLGPEVVERYPIINHDCRDNSALEEVARLDGVKIEVNQAYLEADLKILTGLIEPHPFAGFSGGAKSILPGISSFETMRFMHSFAMVDHPGVANAVLSGNPFKAYVDRVGRAAGLDFLVNVIIDKNKAITAVFSGEPLAAHGAGCVEAAKGAVVQVPEPGDLAVTTGGGFPLDATLYQSSKGLAAVKDLIRPGGTILWVSGCEEGLGGQEFQDLVGSAGGPAGFREKHSRPEHFVIDQWGAQVFFQVLEKAGEILLFSPNLSQDQVAPFGLTLIDDPQAVLESHLAQGARAYVSPEGPYLVGLVKE